MANIWVFRVWRFGWAKLAYPAIGGWKRLFWRLWWRRTLPELAPPIFMETPDYIDAGIISAKGIILHWSPDTTGMPYCGARVGEPWTYEIHHTTCPECTRMGWPVVLQHHTNTR